MADNTTRCSTTDVSFFKNSIIVSYSDLNELQQG